MALIIGVAVFSVLLVGVLARLFLINAREIRRDVERRFDELEARLEKEASAIVEDYLDEERPGSR